MRIHVRSDFTPYPFGRTREDSSRSGEAFREDFLIPALDNLQDTEETLTVDLRGILGYSMEWLHEAFNPLKEQYGLQWLQERLLIEASFPHWPSLVWRLLDNPESLGYVSGQLKLGDVMSKTVDITEEMLGNLTYLLSPAYDIVVVRRDGSSLLISRQWSWSRRRDVAESLRRKDVLGYAVHVYNETETGKVKDDHWLVKHVPSGARYARRLGTFKTEEDATQALATLQE